MLASLRSAGGGRQTSDLCRAEIAARMALGTEADPVFSLAPKASASPYGYCSAALMLTGAVLGAVYLLGPA